MTEILVALLGIVGAFGGGYVGARAQLRLYQRQRADVERDQRRQEAAATMAPIRALLIDVEPQGLALNAAPEYSQQYMAELRRRWEQEARPHLLAIADSSPSPRVRETAHELSKAASNSVVIGALLVRRVLQHADFDRHLERAMQDYASAKQLADKLAALLRGDDEGVG